MVDTNYVSKERKEQNREDFVPDTNCVLLAGGIPKFSVLNSR